MFGDVFNGMGRVFPMPRVLAALKFDTLNYSNRAVSFCSVNYIKDE